MSKRIFKGRIIRCDKTTDVAIATKNRVIRFFEQGKAVEIC